MIIKSNQILKNLNDKVIKGPENKDFTIGAALSDILLTSKAGGKMKMFVMAQRFFNCEDVEVDVVDLALIKQSIESTELYTNLITGQLLIILDNIEKIKEVKTKK